VISPCLRHRSRMSSIGSANGVKFRRGLRGLLGPLWLLVFAAYVCVGV